MPDFNDPNWLQEQRELARIYQDEMLPFTEQHARYMLQAGEHYPSALAEIMRLQKENAELKHEQKHPF